MKDGIIQKRVNNHLFMQEITRVFREQGKKSVTFIVRGFSMRPFLEHERDKVILAPPREPKIGDVVLAEVREQTYALHRVIKIENGTYTDFPGELYCARKDSPLIIGVADGFVRKGKAISTNSRKWRCYSAIWGALKPFRRILLAIYRRI